MVRIDDSNYIDLGKFLKDRRKYLEISQETLAQRMVVPVCQVERWETINLAGMELKEFRKLGFLLKFSPEIFLEGVPEYAYKDWESFISKDFIDY